MKKLGNKIFFLTIFIFLSAGDLLAQGCAQCKMVAEQSAKPGELTEAAFGSNINTGILYLMVIPYILLMFIFRESIFRFFKKQLAKFHS